MRPSENIEKLIEKLRYKTSDETHDRILDNVMKALDEKQKQKPGVTKPVLWRIIMKNTFTKIAAAAVVIIAALIGIHQFGSSTSVFAAMIKNAEQMPWIHMNVVTKRASGEAHVEYWMAFESQIAAQKHDDNRLSFYNGSENKEYLYDSLENKVFVSYTDYDRAPFDSPTEMMKRYIAFLEKDAVNIKTEDKLSYGTKTQVITAQIPEGVDTANITLIRNIDQNLLTRIEVKLSSKTIIMTYDYPERGPEDIYALGAPLDVEIVDLKAPPELKPLQDKIDALRIKDYPPYVAISIPYDSTQLPTTFSGEGNAVSTIWKTKDAWRCDIGYYAKNANITITPETLPNDILRSAELLTPAISTLIKGGNTYTLVRKEWGNGEINKRNGNAYPGNYSIEKVCWPRMTGTVGVPVKWKVESVTGVNGESLILVERSQDGRVPNDRGTYVKPTRNRWFFNPERDYICQKHELCVFLHGDWVINKHWLDGQENPRYNRAGRDYEQIVEIHEYAQTASGRWYPRILSEQHFWYDDNASGEAVVDQRSSFSVRRRIYIKENINLPEGIFNPTDLLK